MTEEYGQGNGRMDGNRNGDHGQKTTSGREEAGSCGNKIEKRTQSRRAIEIINLSRDRWSGSRQA